MSYGGTPDRLSQSAAHWLSQTRFFKPNQQFFDKPATIEIATRNSRALNLKLPIPMASIKSN